MRKRIITLTSAIIGLLGINACSENEETPSLEGVWQLSTVFYQNEYDIDNDGIATTDLLAEYPCDYNERLTIHPDGSGDRFILSPIVWTLAPEVTYECIPGREVIHEFTWFVDSDTNEFVSVTTHGEYRYQLFSDRIIYTVNVEAFRRAYTGDDTATDTATFVFEKVE